MNLINLYKKYASFEGRASRKEHNYYLLFIYLLLSFVGLYVGLVLSLINSRILAGVPVIIIILLLIVPTIATRARRFHDHNLTGWFVIIAPIILCLISALIGVITGFLKTPNWVPGILGGALWIIYVLFLMAKRGTIGANKYGADPLEGLNA